MSIWKIGRLDFVCFIDQAKLREVGEAVIWALTAISVSDLGLLVTNLDINRLGSLMHRLTFPQSFPMRWELRGTYRTSFCSWAFWELLPRVQRNRSCLITSFLAPKPAL